MKFSVLMSVYAREEPAFLDLAIRSMWNEQTLRPDEIVIVKDGVLPPELSNIIKKWEENQPGIFKIVPLSENKGFGVALQKGLKSCSHEIIARMDTDDICSDDRFEKQIEFFKKNDVDIVGSRIGEFKEEPSQIFAIRKVPLQHEKIYRFAKHRSPMNHMTVLFRKSSVINAGNYSGFSSSQDYHLWAKMLISGAKFANIPECLVFVRTKGMIDRRHGLKYLTNEMKVQKSMLDMGFLTYWEFLRNVSVRAILRLWPKFLLKIIYKKFARKRVF